MQFKKVVETQDGKVEIDAEFDADEVGFLIEYAVIALMRSGAMPYLAQNEAEVGPTTETLQ